MSEILEKVNINLNQNIWALIVCLTALGVSEYYALLKLMLIAWLLSWLCAGILCCCLIFYTVNYCTHKVNKIKTLYGKPGAMKS